MHTTVHKTAEKERIYVFNQKISQKMDGVRDASL